MTNIQFGGSIASRHVNTIKKSGFNSRKQMQTYLQMNSDDRTPSKAGSILDDLAETLRKPFRNKR